jgi:hypothetical protein
LTVYAITGVGIGTLNSALCLPHAARNSRLTPTVTATHSARGTRTNTVLICCCAHGRGPRPPFDPMRP